MRTSTSPDQTALKAKIHYAQCWEDPAPLLRSFQVGPEDDVLTIASGGENTFALLLENPKSIWAIDHNPAQIYLMELKIKAMQMLEYGEYVRFIGARPHPGRCSVYRDLRQEMSEGAQAYWDAHAEDIEGGIIHCGKFEQYLRLFRRLLVPVVHSPRDIDCLLSTRSIEDQAGFYRRSWNNFRWRGLFRLMFSRHLLGGIGRGRLTFRYVNVPSVAEELLRRTDHGFTQVPISENFFVEFILRGSYQDLHRSHPCLKESNFAFLRRNVHRIHLLCTGLDESFRQLVSVRFSKVNASDIFEYMSAVDFEKCLRNLSSLCRSGALLAFWTLFVPRPVPKELSEEVVVQNTELCLESSDIRTFFYDSFCLWRLNC